MIVALLVTAGLTAGSVIVGQAFDTVNRNRRAAAEVVR
jgi:hypothetical protein